jgi:hypothetical protein
VQDTACWVEIVADVVKEDALEHLLRRFLPVVGNLLEGLIGRGEDGIVCFCAVEDLD